MRQFISKIINRFRPTPEDDILEMVLETKVINDSISLPEGYILRNLDLKDGTDVSKFADLLLKSDMGTCRLEYWQDHILPKGFFVIEYISTGELVATCFASHHPTDRHAFGGNLGWLAVDPDHRGKKLGQAVVIEVMNRLIRAGYERIYLGTHDNRLPAIKIYLQLGWVPYIYDTAMSNRWKNIYADLKIDSSKPQFFNFVKQYT